MNTFNSLCIGACVFMIFIGMAAAFVGSIEDTYPYSLNVNTSEAEDKMTINDVNTLILTFGGSIGGLLTGLTYLLTRSTNLMGICIFGTFFWTSWGLLYPIISAAGFFNNIPGTLLISMITVGMGIMFVGAVNGMLHGGIWMK